MDLICISYSSRLTRLLKACNSIIKVTLNLVNTQNVIIQLGLRNIQNIIYGIILYSVMVIAVYCVTSQNWYIKT